ncbi:MAG: penicillin-binding protein 2 [Patescibacteria group bacterium]|nr:penicillin-binding protein 2 [Patescibacteria group bacterium]
MLLFLEDKSISRARQSRKINSQQELEIEEIFLDDFLKNKTRESEIQERKIELSLEKKVFWLVFFLGIGIFGLLFCSTFNLQIIKHQKYEILAQNNKFLNSKIKAERGVIYARDGEQLVFNEVSFDLFAQKSAFSQGKNEDVLKKVSEILGKDFQEIKEKINQDPQDLVEIAKNLSHQNFILIETKKEEELSGVEVKKRILRKYREDESLSHILGYLGEISSDDLKKFGSSYELGDYVGKEGIERFYEASLVEEKGLLEIERDAQGQEISRKIKRAPASGKSLVLALDLSLQEKLKNSLKKVMAEIGSGASAAVALNPQNGEVLASVSLPSFNNNLFAQGISKIQFEKLNQDPGKPQLNRVIGGAYPVGSTIKPLIASAALSEGIIDEKTELFCPLSLCLEHKYSGELECFPDWQFHGWTNIKKAIAESVNPFFYLIGGGYFRPSLADSKLPKEFTGLGVEKIKKYLLLFGWGEKTGIDLPGEIEGRVPDPVWKENYFSERKIEEQIWYLGDTYNLSIGQGYLLTTPIQVAVAFSSLVNGGKIIQPHLVKGILTSEKKELEEMESQIKRENFISQSTLSIVKEGMTQTVRSPSGSAFLLSSLKVKVGAKTGTAQTSIKDVYHNWLTVFAPSEDPQIVLTIVIENVKGTRIAAQKVAKEVLEWYFEY